MTFHLDCDTYLKTIFDTLDVPPNVADEMKRIVGITDQTEIDNLPVLPIREVRSGVTEKQDVQKSKGFLDTLVSQRLISQVLVDNVMNHYDHIAGADRSPRRELSRHRLNMSCHLVLHRLCKNASREINGITPPCYSDGVKVYSLLYADDRVPLLHEFQFLADSLRSSRDETDPKVVDFWSRVSNAVGIYTIMMTYNIPRTQAAACLTVTKMSGSTRNSSIKGIWITNSSDPMYDWLWNKVFQVIMVTDRLYGTDFYKQIRSERKLSHPNCLDWYNKCTERFDGKRTNDGKNSPTVTKDTEFFIKSLSMSVQCYQRAISNDQWTTEHGQPGIVEFIYPVDPTEAIHGGQTMITATGTVRPRRVVQNRNLSLTGQRTVSKHDTAYSSQFRNHRNYEHYNYDPERQAYFKNPLHHINNGATPVLVNIGFIDDYGANPNPGARPPPVIPPAPPAGPPASTGTGNSSRTGSWWSRIVGRLFGSNPSASVHTPFTPVGASPTCTRWTFTSALKRCYDAISPGDRVTRAAAGRIPKRRRT